ncbi:BNR repeat-like domain-containing protein [Caballeronia arationis]|uniref:BNR repeat-like domain-containing protein n=1 Tax=Caballeronia arationis TaxID=1777142 RepID=A0A7Z7ICN5_9BURK|nr:sialidase family protein [Caballeronia arationis]SOE82111.1 BNR repeat-like domain-containing protein [Caballeronia arationis]
MRRNKATVRLIGIPLATVLATSTAWAADPIRVTGVPQNPNPFASCPIGASPQGGSTNYVNAEVEPWLAVNPHTAGNLIGVWQQDRWSDGGAHGLVAGFSFDGGSTWGTTPLPFSACAPGGLPYERATDPWVSIGPDGTAYAVSVSFNASNNNNAVAAAVSTTGGRTWNNLKVIIANDEPGAQFFNDKESVTADPIHAGTAYAVWDRLESPNANPYADMHTQAYRGPTFISKTVNGGQTWSPPKIIVNFVASRRQTIGNQIVVDPRTGTLYNFFDLIQPPFGVSAGKVAFIKSTDQGASWTQPQIIADLRTVGVTDPNTGEPLRTGDIIPEPAIDPSTGYLYVVWQDSRFSGGQFDEIAISKSTDGGSSWSTPSRVNTMTGRAAFNPSIRVNAVTAKVAVTYYDFRGLEAGNTTSLPTSIWLTTSPTAGGPSFVSEQLVSGPFNMRTAPMSRGFFVGDYQGLEVQDTKFLPFFVQTNSGNTTNRTDVFFARETPAQ